jgi:hypothetical protein
VLLGKRKRPLPKFCANCPTEARAVMRCIECNAAFCKKCAESIHRIPILRDHNVRPILDVLDEYLVDVDELPDGWDPVEDARRKARREAQAAIDAAIQGAEGEMDDVSAVKKKHTKIIYALTPTALAKYGDQV